MHEHLLTNCHHIYTYMSLHPVFVKVQHAHSTIMHHKYIYPRKKYLFAIFFWFFSSERSGGKQGELFNHIFSVYSSVANVYSIESLLVLNKTIRNPCSRYCVHVRMAKRTCIRVNVPKEFCSLRIRVIFNQI